MTFRVYSYTVFCKLINFLKNCFFFILWFILLKLKYILPHYSYKNNFIVRGDNAFCCGLSSNSLGFSSIFNCNLQNVWFMLIFSIVLYFQNLHMMIKTVHFILKREMQMYYSYLCMSMCVHLYGVYAWGQVYVSLILILQVIYASHTFPQNIMDRNSFQIYLQNSSTKYF